MSAGEPLGDAPAASRYVVGIDLGTTNSAVAYVDAESPRRPVETFRVPQLVAPGEVEARDVLPSFHYEAASGELPPGALKLPWDAKPKNFAVGFFARDQGAKVPGRLVVSAKSWLCHQGVDRSAALLPWQGADDVERLSPVEVSARYLAHLREAWDHAHPQHPLAEQDVVVTLPASFDEVARELTVKAAQRAGLPKIVLLEEPQAAFYDWIQAHRDDWQNRVRPGQKILVCDIGGGTTDFTLILVRRDSAGQIQLHRVAVGEHLILGGDNLDLALAHAVEKKLAGDGKLRPQQWSVLVRNCRVVKETLLGAGAPNETIVTVPGAGSRLIGGALQTSMTRAEVEQLLVEGFLPAVSVSEKPSSRRSGFQEFGLPYAADPAITKYLAHFLTTHRTVGWEPHEVPTDRDPARPDVVLFNGGFFESPALRERLLDVLSGWFGEGPNARPEVLGNPRLDLAVAHGAAYYGLVRRGLGVRIAAGLARTYYIGASLKSGEPPAAVCLLPAGVEEGKQVDLEQPKLDLLIRQPVEFPLHVSSTRLVDQPGQVFPVDREQMTPLPPIRTVVGTRKAGEADRVPVQLHARLTEIGTLDLWCTEANGPRSWRLQFDVRAATQTDRSGHAGSAERLGFVDASTIDACRALIRQAFAPGEATPALDPRELVKRLEETLESSRDRWPPSVLRELWSELLDVSAGRTRGEVHEARWLNLLGFALRPGYGMAVDDWRVAQTWKLFQGKKVVHPSAACRIEYLVLWRRIGAGLAAGQQQALAEPLLTFLRPHFKTAAKQGGGASKSSNKNKGKKPAVSVFGVGGHETAEGWRLLGSLELLPAATKHDLGDFLSRMIPREESAAIRAAQLWALGRIGARSPLYGPLNAAVATATAERWLVELIDDALDDDAATLAVMQLARRTHDRWRDVSDDARKKALNWLDRRGAPDRLKVLVDEGGELDTTEQGQVFGESLPVGLSVRTEEG